jgi:hypothetical protein
MTVAAFTNADVTISATPTALLRWSWNRETPHPPHREAGREVVRPRAFGQPKALIGGPTAREAPLAPRDSPVKA